MSRLSKNVILNVLGQVVIIILSFVAVKFIFVRLGKDALGIIFFAQTLTLVLRFILDLGLGSTTVREVAAHYQDERPYVLAFLRTASLVYWAFYGLLSVGIYVSAPFLIHRWVIVSDLDITQGILALRILGISAMLTLPRTFYISIFRGIERMEFNNGIDVATVALQQIGTVVLLAKGDGLVAVSCWLAVCFSLGIVAYVVICGHFFGWSALRPGFSLEVVRRNWRLTSHMASISLLGIVQTQTDKAISSKLLPLGLFGYYSMAYGTASRASLIANSIGEASLPSLSSAFSAGDEDVLMSRYRKLQDFLSYGTAPIFAGIVFFALPLFTYILSSAAATQLLLPTGFLCVGFLLNASLNGLYIYSIAVGRPDIAARSNMYAMVVVSPMTFLLVYFWGIRGAAFSWIVYHLFAFCYQGRRTCNECLGISIRRWLTYPLQSLGLAFLTYGTAWLVASAFASSSLILLVIAYLCATSVFILAAYSLIGQELRQTFTAYFRRRPRLVTELQ